jgi:hypothetical protein
MNRRVTWATDRLCASTIPIVDGGDERSRNGVDRARNSDRCAAASDDPETERPRGGRHHAPSRAETIAANAGSSASTRPRSNRPVGVCCEAWKAAPKPSCARARVAAALEAP